VFQRIIAAVDFAARYAFRKALVTEQNPSGGFPFVRDLLENEVQVWIVDLDDRTAPSAIVDSLLSPEEQERAARFVFEPDAWHFSLGRAALRLGLALYLSRPPNDISIRIAERGKPYVEDGGLHFNVSHCGGVGLIAFTRVGEIGIDVEAVQPGIEGLDIASENFTADETEWIASAPSPLAQAQRFTRLWTRKEAVLKATGKGIAEGLNSFDISRGGEVAIRSLRTLYDTDPHYLIVEDIEISESIYAALARPAIQLEIKTNRVDVTKLFAQIRRIHPHMA
jgi:4'-phosphopantetheinyl transferase